MNHLISSSLRPAARRSAREAVALFALGAMFSGASFAQVPDNAVLVGTASTQVPSSGTTGLFYVTLPSSQNGGGQITPLTGLPPQLTVQYPTFGGCYSVLRRPADGTIFVGDGAAGNNWCRVHILKVSGSVVTSYRSLQLGQSPGSAIVGQMALLPDGRVVLTCDAMPTSPIAILDDRPTVPTVTAIKLDSSSALLNDFVYGLALSRDGATAYVTHQTTQPTFAPGHLYSIDITQSSPVVPKLLHTWPKMFLPKLTMDRNGALYTTAMDPLFSALPSIEKITFNSNNAVSVQSTPVTQYAPIVGTALVRGSGQFVFASSIWPGTTHNASVMMSDQAGTLSVLSKPPAGGWGVPYAMDINNAFETYGQTKAQDRHWFAEFPNPGGSPQVGNTGFSLTLESKTVPLATFVAIGLAKTQFSFMGVSILADPAIVVRLNPGTSVTLPAPIPNNSAFLGAQVFVQGVHVEGSGTWAATRGLDLVIH